MISSPCVHRGVLGMRLAAWPIGFFAMIGATGAAEYRVTNLGGLPGNQSDRGVIPMAINPSGTIIVGESDGTSGFYAVKWAGGAGSVMDLGSLSGVSISEATGVNDSGQIAGSSDLSLSAYQYHPFLYSNGHMTDLGTLPGYDGGKALGINKAGQVVGDSFTLSSFGTPNLYHAFLYSNGTMTDMGIPTQSEATAINDKGQVTGTFADASNFSHVFIYDHGTLTDLGPLTGVAAKAINNNGQIVGIWNNDAFLYTNGSFKDLGGLPGPGPTQTYALGINDAGTIVGYTYASSGDPLGFRAFVSYDDQRLIDLNSLISPASGWTIRRAFAISQNGQIVAAGGLNRDDNDEALLLTPVPDGDANLDGTVNFSDLLLLAQNYGQPGGWAQGDFNHDGVVNFADLLLLAQHYGRSSPTTGAGESPVPEPALLPLALVAALTSLSRMRMQPNGAEAQVSGCD